MPSETYSGAGSYTFDVPSAVQKLNIKIWGAGGADGGDGDNPGGSGGSGAFIECEVDAVSPGDTLDIDIGGGGSLPAGGENEGGDGGSGTLAGDGGGGGGWTKILDNNDSLLMAAGGGGGGGGGGSLGSGGDGGDGQASSTGSSLTAGGDGGSDDGSNSGVAGGGGGGGGYEGGSGGGVSDYGGGGGVGGGSLTAGTTLTATDGGGKPAGVDGEVTITYVTPPSNLSATTVDNDQIDLSWDDSPDEDEYHIYRATSSGSSLSDYTQIDTVAADTTSYSDTGLDDGEKYYYRVTAALSGGHESTPTSEASATTSLPAPTDFTIDAQSGDQFDCSWTDNTTDEDGYRLQVSSDGGSTWTTDKDLAPGTTSATTTNLLDGQQYELRVQAYTEHTTATSNTDTGTTSLPDITSGDISLGNGVEDEIAVDWNDVIDNGEYDIQYRETDDEDNPDPPAWIDEASVSESTTSYTITGLEDGEEYEVRMRTRTSDVAGDWSDSVSIVTKFHGASDVSLTVQSTSQIDIEFVDNSDNEDGFDIEVREELDPARDTGYGDWTTETTLDPNTTSYSLVDLKPNHEYEVRIRAFTEDASATSGTASATTDVEYAATWTVELRRNDGEILALHESDGFIEGSLTWRWATNMLATWSLEVPPSPVLEEWRDSDAYLWYDGQLWIWGPWHRFESNEVLAGKGNGWRLKQGGTTKRYQSIAGYKAAEDYIDSETQFTADVTPPTPNTIAEDKTVQDVSTTAGFEELFSPSSTDPYTAENDQLVPLQTAFTVEGEDYDRGSGIDDLSTDEYSGSSPTDGQGSAAGLQDSGDYVEYDFTLDYDIPADSFTVYARLEGFDGDDTPDTKWIIDPDGDNRVLYNTSFSTSTPTWTELADLWDDNGLSAGDHTLRVEVSSAGTDRLAIDVVAPLDTRYSYTFDDAVTTAGDGSNYLDGPEHYPTITLEGQEHDDVNNIPAATLSITIADTSGDQALQISNDGTTNWYPQDGSEESTSMVTVDPFPTVGSTIRGRVTVTGWGSRTSTPATGYKAQTVSDWTLEIDTDSLAVFDDRRYTGNHFENLKSICKDAGLDYLIRHEDDSDTIEVFDSGDLTDSLTLTDEDVLDHNRVLDREGYGNKATVYGAIDAQSGEPLEETAEDPGEIQEHGEVLAPSQSDPRLETEADVKSFARRVVAEAVLQRRTTGQLDVVPSVMGTPGREYTLSYGDFDDDAVVLQSIVYRDLHGVRLDFEDDRDVADALASIRGETKKTQDAIN